MSIHVKICGLATPDMAERAVDFGADMIGLVFYERSPRHVATETAADIVRAIHGKASIVGLFVDPAPARIEMVLSTVRLSHIQLHGSESPDTVAAIRSQSGLPVIKAAAISSPGDVARAEQDYGAIADMLLFDAKPPADADRPGGNGVSFDLEALADVTGVRPWLLSGGLTPESVFDAVDGVQPLPGFAGVDVSSGVETAPGRKDPALMRSFIGAARAAMTDYMDKDA